MLYKDTRKKHKSKAMTLTKRKSGESTPNPLDTLLSKLSGDMMAVNALILDKMQSDIPLIPELAGHLIAAGGKRIRPLLTLASAAFFGYEGNRQHRLAACVEFIHTATLLHDDVVDASDLRRGKASANAVFGNEAAVLVGDFLFSRAFQLMVEDGSLDVLRILSNASAVIAEGEVMQLSTTNNLETTVDDYMRVVEAKTAALFAAACEVGAVIADRPASDCGAMRAYGAALGVAFQISDDILDYSADQALLGKTVGDDFREGKMTLPVILALQDASDEEKEFWQRTMVDLDQKDDDFEQAAKILKRHNAYIRSAEYADVAAKKGLQYISNLKSANGFGQDFVSTIQFAANRDF